MINCYWGAMQKEERKKRLHLQGKSTVSETEKKDASMTLPRTLMEKKIDLLFIRQYMCNERQTQIFTEATNQFFEGSLLNWRQ